MRKAVFSRCKRYRYELIIVWNALLPTATIIMMNPSTATETEDDNTSSTCINQCRHLGYGSIIMVNVCAYISTNPKVLLSVDDPVGPENYAYLQLAIDSADTIICAWGNLNKKWYSPVMAMLRGYSTMCFDITKKGMPHHPLHRRRCDELTPYSYSAMVARRLSELDRKMADQEERLQVIERKMI
jgi:hypothetical protein